MKCYVHFVNKEADKKRSDWKLSVCWAWFIVENREPAVGLVFNASSVKDVLLQLFNKIIGA